MTTSVEITTNIETGLLLYSPASLLPVPEDKGILSFSTRPLRHCAPCCSSAPLYVLPHPVAHFSFFTVPRFYKENLCTNIDRFIQKTRALYFIVLESHNRQKVTTILLYAPLLPP